MLDTPRPLRSGLDGCNGGSSGDSVFLIDAAAGMLLDATAAGWQAWGIDPATAAPPVPLDRAMPALQHLLRCAEGRFEGVVTFWTRRGAVALHCTAEGLGEGRFVVRARTDHDMPHGARDGTGDGAHRGTHQGARDGTGIPVARHAVPHTGGTSGVTAGARLAHELRTPLAAAIAYAEVLKDERFGPLANGRYRDYARNIYESARHALGVVEGMLGGDPERASAQELAFADLDAAAIAESCLAVARPLAEEAQLRLEAPAGAAASAHHRRRGEPQADAAQPHHQRHQVRPRRRQHHAERRLRARRSLAHSRERHRPRHRSFGAPSAATPGSASACR